MVFDPKLKLGEVIKNEKLISIFGCANMSGMRRSKKTNTLVIVSDHTKGLYEDKWIGDTLYYTGMGKKADQGLNKNQNRTLNESGENGVDVFLFEVFKANEYIYMGQVELVEIPYEEKQKDEDGIMRNVWVFPVKRINDEKVSINIDILKENNNKKERRLKKLTYSELKEKAIESGTTKVSSRTTTSQTYERNVYVMEYAKRKANGICQLCSNPAPFRNEKGEPYLETHHIKWLSEGGSDTIENTVALCPNCHKKMHIVASESDKLYLIKNN